MCYITKRYDRHNNEIKIGKMYMGMYIALDYNQGIFVYIFWNQTSNLQAVDNTMK